MSPATENSASSPASTRYYRSFISYEVPFRPDDPIEFAETEGMPSFYAARLNSAEQVVQFDKIRLVRDDRPAQPFSLGADYEPAAAVYFRVRRDPAAAGPQLGEVIDFARTESLEEFYAGQVNPSGRSGQALLFRKEKAFSDVYRYWPNGHLRRRTMTKYGEAPVDQHFDPTGRPIPAELAAPDDVELVAVENVLAASEMFSVLVTGRGAAVAARALKQTLEAIPEVHADQGPANIPGEVAPLEVRTPAGSLQPVVRVIGDWAGAQANPSLGLSLGYRGRWKQLPSGSRQAETVLNELLGNTVRSRR